MKTEKSGLKKVTKKQTKKPEVKNPTGEMVELPLSVVNKVFAAYERMKADEKVKAEQAASGERKPDDTVLEELLCSARNKLAFLAGMFSGGSTGTDAISLLDYRYSSQGLTIILEQTLDEVEKALAEIFPGYGKQKGGRV